jgi:hypothetical protein
MQLLEFTPAHLATIRLQSAQAHEGVSQEGAELAIGLGPAWSLMRSEDVLACGGYFALKPTLALGWMYIAGDIGPRHFIRVVRAINEKLKGCPYERVDFMVQQEFPQGHRMARLIGATWTGAITVQGRDGTERLYAIYSRGSGHGWN